MVSFIRRKRQLTRQCRGQIFGNKTSQPEQSGGPGGCQRSLHGMEPRSGCHVHEVATQKRSNQERYPCPRLEDLDVESSEQGSTDEAGRIASPM